ncbi:trimeric intracellular cation channel family protein [Devriesea agamarum]|uniref:trimeric intracellular cation channel family protein n=1 Tax=Devriesea agamarum TaxID=472569 RepID=UPI000A070C2A|nr:TRIC cation channel family protein [Devriesea agamarum]
MTPGDLLTDNGLLRALDLLGVVVMGIVGGALARRLRFDAIGFAVIGMVSGLGGGIVRDLVIVQGVPAAFAGPWYLVCALIGSTFAFLVRTDGRGWRIVIGVLDAVALGLWAATGTAKSLAAGLDVLPAILLGVISAVGGGAIRDIMVGRIPVIFGGGPLYATSALLSSVATVAVVLSPVPAWFVIPAAGLGAMLAILSAWKRWHLPTHTDWSVTLSASQLRSLVRRTRRAERQRIASQTGQISVVDLDGDDLADDAQRFRG